MLNKLILIGSVVLGFIGCESITIDENDSKAKAILIIAASSFKSDAPDNQPTPDINDSCPTCNGTGKVGDGRIFAKCLDCDGTGKVKDVNLETITQPAPVEEKKVVTIYSESWCRPCQEWKLNPVYKKKFEEFGFKIIEKSSKDMPKHITSIPYFEVELGNKSGSFTGIITLEYVRNFFNEQK